jgi:DNA-binding response OmpR family regulator
VTPRILIVDDEEQMRELLKVCIEPLNFKLDEAQDGKDALKKINDQQYDLILLDVMMPYIDGLSLLSRIRKEDGTDVPIIMLTALGETDHIVKGLYLGADDYITKPFEPRELLARIQSVLRRKIKNNKGNVDTLIKHDLAINTQKMKISYKANEIPFTKKEMQLLSRMLKHDGQVYSREQLLDLEWGHDYDGDTRTVDVHIRNIREKLKQSGYQKEIIETVWGIGYKVVEE